MRRRKHRIPETAAAHLVTQVLTGSVDETAGALVQRLSGRRYDALDAAYLLDRNGRLEGTIPLSDLLALPGDAPIREAMRAAPSVTPDEDQEEVASLAIRSEQTDVPVVDGERRLLGVVPARALIGILRREHIEDLHRFAGIEKHSAQAVHAIRAAPWQRARSRLPWLLIGLIGSVAATLLVARFETTLQANVAIAFFLPGIVYLADAIGTQAEAVAVRGLSLQRTPISVLLYDELAAGALMGLGLGLVALPAAYFAFGDPALAAAVALALFIAGSSASSLGLLLPWLFARLGRDPALVAGPVGTILQDLLSLSVYFVLVILLVV